MFSSLFINVTAQWSRHITGPQEAPDPLRSAHHWSLEQSRLKQDQRSDKLLSSRRFSNKQNPPPKKNNNNNHAKLWYIIHYIGINMNPFHQQCIKSFQIPSSMSCMKRKVACSDEHPWKLEPKYWFTKNQKNFLLRGSFSWCPNAFTSFIDTYITHVDLPATDDACGEKPIFRFGCGVIRRPSYE